MSKSWSRWSHTDSYFCNGLQPQPKLLLGATVDGSLMSKSVEDAIVIIERMTLIDHQVKYNRGNS